ncbi:MAG: 2Fe-2S iron-sulfur cluster-binding protein [Halobacteria archaeon]
MEQEKHRIEFVDREETVYCSEKETILGSCIDAGLNGEYSCRVGMCLACVAELVDGEVRQPGAHGLSEEQATQFVLTCMARPKTDLKLDLGVYPESI